MIKNVICKLLFNITLCVNLNRESRRVAHILKENRSKMVRIGCLVLMMLVALSVFGQVMQGLALEAMIHQSDAMFEGEIVETKCFYGPLGNIYTKYGLEVSKDYLGDGQHRLVYFSQPGGVIGNEGLNVDPSVKFEVGQKGVIGLRHIEISGMALAVPTNSFFSWLPYSEHSNSYTYFGGSVYKTTDLDALIESVSHQKVKAISPFTIEEDQPESMVVIQSISPTISQAGTGQILTINGTGFGASRGNGAVFFRFVDGPPTDFRGAYEYVSWSDTRIQVIIRSTAGTGPVFVRNNAGMTSAASAQTLVITYNVSNVNFVEHPYFHDFPKYDNGGYSFVLSTNTTNGGVDITSIPAAMDALDRATSTWNTSTGFSIFTEENCGTTAIQTPVSDGVSVISFDNNNFDLDVVYGSSVLGVMFSRFGTCLGDWEVTEMDMILRRDGNPNGFGGSVDWEYGPGTPSGSEIDFESVVLHELGHGHQLGHCLVSGAVMFPSISAGTTNRTLSSSETQGGGYVQNQSIGFFPPVNTFCSPPFNQPRKYEAYDAGNRCSAFLPLDLISLEAKMVNENEALITWETANEIDHDRIELEMKFASMDGAETEWRTAQRFYEPVEVIEGINHYHLLQSGLKTGIYYYRLKIVAMDGSVEWSSVVAVECHTSSIETMEVWVDGKRLHAQLDLGSLNSEVILNVHSIDGKRILRSQPFYIEGTGDVDLDLSHLSSGVYILNCLSFEHDLDLPSRKVIIR